MYCAFIAGHVGCVAQAFMLRVCIVGTSTTRQKAALKLHYKVPLTSFCRECFHIWVQIKSTILASPNDKITRRQTFCNATRRTGWCWHLWKTIVMRFGVTCHFESIHRSVTLYLRTFFTKKKYMDHCYPTRVLWDSMVPPDIPVPRQILL